VRKVWSKYLGYGITAEIEIDFDTGELIMRPEPGTPLDFPDYDVEAGVKAHRELLQEVYDDVAKITGRTIVSHIPATPGIPGCTIAASPHGRPLGVAPARWGI